MNARYKVLRMMGCSVLTAMFISLLNKVQGVPEGYIVFLHTVIEYDRYEVKEKI